MNNIQNIMKYGPMAAETFASGEIYVNSVIILETLKHKTYIPLSLSINLSIYQI